MDKPQFKFQVKGNFYDGCFKSCVDASGEWVGQSPADFSDEVGRFQYSYKAIDEAIHSASSAFKTWRKSKLSDRIELLKKYQTTLKCRSEELAQAISREVGKPFWEAKTEVAAMIHKVDITVEDSLRLISDFEITLEGGARGICRYRPLGVMAVIGPFNFPGHLPNGHWVPAILTGNTVIFKPSEKTPMVGQILAECFEEAGFPAGVFNLIQGEKEVGRRLCIHEGVDGVLFTGSYEVGTRIKQDTLHQHWKLLVLEMGGKNAMIVWEDADLQIAVHEALIGAFLTTGQRCSATSRVIVHKKLFDSFVECFHERSKAFSIGHPCKGTPFMGPLIDSGAVDRYLKFLGVASREGCELIMRGKALDLPFRGNYVTPSICIAKNFTVEQSKKSIFQQTELFAPSVAILGAEDLDEAIEQANVTQYGLVTSVFTRSREIYEKCQEELEVGLVNWNKSTVGASSRLPFGGLKKSGNHRPTGLSATLYCTYPVASLEISEVPPIAQLALKTPGLNWI